MRIEELFDTSKNIRRNIEKVITYAASQDDRLMNEITEYIATDSIEEQMAKLLRNMQHGLQQGAGSEIGVWVSGFYGSGKSSFTKYLGFALDATKQAGGVPFMKHLQNRLNKAETKALLNAISGKYPAVVVMLDLASEMIAGAAMKEVSTVLFYKVLQWAGYSQNLKVAALERKLEKEGRLDELKRKIREELEVEWEVVQNDPLIIDSIVPKVAHELYPKLFPTDHSFSGETSDFVQFENNRVEEMIDIVRQRSGKEFIIFVIDEVGQYVGPRQHLIQNLDGLAKNLKEIGKGKVWIIGTAQQTLTEDDSRAALNSPELFKLSARFPLSVDLLPQDIKEICYTRLLGKSEDGKKALKELFSKQGQALRQNTRLEDAKYYDAELTEKAFVELYPFLPAHFEILLQLLGALAKTTGGYGLRSAIKVVQDTLIEKNAGSPAAVEKETGWLANLVIFYDVLEKDVQRAFVSLHNAVKKTGIRFAGSPIHLETAKTVVMLQILDNIPATARNIAALMHDHVSGESKLSEVEKALTDLSQDSTIPFGLQDGTYRFFSEKIGDITKERSALTVRTVENRRIRNETLRELFSPLPSVKLHGSFTVSAGLKAVIGSSEASLGGESNAIQINVIFAPPSDYDKVKADFQTESIQRLCQNNIYLMIREDQAAEDLAIEMFRSQEIARRHQQDPDQEVRQYCDSQRDLAEKNQGLLSVALVKGIKDGSFIFRGQTTAVSSLDQDVQAAAKKQLESAASRVFERYDEAPVRVDTNLAELLLKVSDLRSVHSKMDPLTLIKVSGGTSSVDTSHKALVSMRDFVTQNGSVQGRVLSEHFSSPPFGWSPDTIRYLVAALLMAGTFKLNVAGKSVTVPGAQAIEALKSNNAFKNIGVSLQHDPPPPEKLALASKRLTELSGNKVTPLPVEIAKAASQYFMGLQGSIAALPGTLKRLGLSGVDAAETLLQDLKNSLAVDCSDAVNLLGVASSRLFDSIEWVCNVTDTLKEGMEDDMAAISLYLREAETFADTGVLGTLKNTFKELFDGIRPRLASEDFHTYRGEVSSALTSMDQAVTKAVGELSKQQSDTIQSTIERLHEVGGWGELTQQEQSNLAQSLEASLIETEPDMDGLKRLVANAIAVQDRIQEVERHIAKTAKEKRAERGSAGGKDSILRRSVKFPKRIYNEQGFVKAEATLRKAREEAQSYGAFDVTIELEETE